MNQLDTMIVASAAVLAAAFVVLFAFGKPASLGNWCRRRLLPGVAGLVGLTALSSWWLYEVAKTDAAACRIEAAKGLTYDCEDAFLIVPAAIFAGALAVLLFVIGLSGVHAARHHGQVRASS